MNKQLKKLTLDNPISESLSIDKNESRPQVLDKLKTYLDLSSEILEKGFKDNLNIRNLVHARAFYIDHLLIRLWQYFESNEDLCLIAVGGYGRGELHPYSDIDLLILSQDNLSDDDKGKIESFISTLWDCHLKVGHSVRSWQQNIDLAKEELTITTNLMESRLLAGNKSLYSQMRDETAPDKIWDPITFYQAKTAEQKERYKKFQGSSFGLEPNIKSSPGGLRDIHLVGWIAQRIYYPKSLFELIKLKIISKKEYYTLMKCQLFIWKIRFALHLVAQKPEDRLLFDYQKSVAEVMRFKDTAKSLGVEKMMKRYYRSVSIIRNMCDILFQIMEKQHAQDDKLSVVENINDDFQLINNRVDLIDPDGFIKKPQLLIEVFYQVALHPACIGLSAQTQRSIQAHRYLINNKFRSNKSNKELFLKFWHFKHSRSRAFFLMKRSGVLSDYLAAFKQISGQMQYDMFHSYTVDEHSLMLLQNLTDFANPDYDNLFPLCSEIMQKQKNPEILFLAGLFHDIGKGRGGDHSEIGAEIAKSFCANHQIDKTSQDAIIWLVANHLVMSLIAQKKDISDPLVIKHFAEIVKTQDYLDWLYILTVADIRATSNNLWNSWKDALLKGLYISTSEYLQKEDSEKLHRLAGENKQNAIKTLLEKNYPQKILDDLWSGIDDKYFEKRSVDAIIWQTELILSSGEEQPVIGIRNTRDKSASEIFVYSKDKKYLFAVLTSTLSQQGLTIYAANIYTDDNGYCYDSFFVLDSDGKTLKGKNLIHHLKQTIVNNLKSFDLTKLAVKQYIPRQYKYFSIPTEVIFKQDEYTNLTTMELVSRDQPGLLAAIGQAFVKTNVRLHDARIVTLGEKVEDVFVISDSKNQPVNDLEYQEKIRQTIHHYLD